MSNKGVKGRVVYANKTNEGIPGLIVQAVDFDPFFSQDDILKPEKRDEPVQTDENGNFHITYSPSSYRVWKVDRNPDIVVRIYNSNCRLLYESQEFKDVSEETLIIEDIVIHENNIKGWLVTNATLNPEKGTPVSLSDNNKIKYLIDGDKMFPAITDAVVAAQSSVNLMTLFFQVDNKETEHKKEGIITKFQVGFQEENPPSDDCKIWIAYRLDEELKEKAETIPVRVMLADIPISPSDTVKEVEDFFQDTEVKVSDFNKNFSLLHAKALIVDHTKAFLMGSPIKQGYFNSQVHSIVDARSKGRLLHDVSLEVEGPAVAPIEKTFATIWNTTDASPVELPEPATPQQTENNQAEKKAVAVQVLRTMPGGTFKQSNNSGENLPHGETGILEAYQRAIANAKKFIYFENQYFTSPEIVNALKHRMKDQNKPKLQLIFVINFRPDLPGYPDRQIDVINTLKIVAESNGHQLGVYTLWSRVEPGGSEIEGTKEYEVAPIYVHSKVAIIDDVWATVGSANLDGTSLNYHQFSLLASGVMIEKLVNELHDDIWKFLWDAFWYMGGFLVKEVGGFTIRILVALIGIILKIITDFDGLMQQLRDIWEIITDLSYSEIKGIIKDVFIRTSEHAVPHRSQQPARSVEMNLVIYNGIEGQSKTDLIAELRELLSSEHLFMADELPKYKLQIPQDPSKKADSSSQKSDDPSNMTWVEYWDDVAEKNLEAIKNNKKTPEPILRPRILKWTPEVSAKKYLRALGVSKKKLKTKDIKFNFESCKFESKGIFSKIADQYPNLFI